MSKRLKVLFLLGLLIIGGDQAIKFWTHSSLPIIHKGGAYFPYGGVAVFKDFHGINFSLTHQINKGTAWGLLAQYHEILLYARLILIGGLLVYTFFINKVKSLQIPLTFIIGGAISNVIDKFTYTHVVDTFFFELWGYDFPIFNLADCFISLGVFWLFVHSFIQSKKKDQFEPEEELLHEEPFSHEPPL